MLKALDANYSDRVRNKQHLNWSKKTKSPPHDYISEVDEETGVSLKPALANGLNS